MSKQNAFPENGGAVGHVGDILVIIDTVFISEKGVGNDEEDKSDTEKNIGNDERVAFWELKIVKVQGEHLFCPHIL